MKAPLGALLLLLASSVFPACSETERTEAVTAEITAAQMEGRNAARKIINKQWTDTSRLQKAIRDARNRKCFYDSTGHPECGAAFDSAYIGTLRAVNPRAAALAD